MASSVEMKPISEALEMEEVGLGIFKTFVLSDYCFGDWAWGGLSASLVQRAATRFMTTSGTDGRHPDVVNMQLQYLRPVLSKVIQLLARQSRVTRPISTVHVSLIQDEKECVVGYVNLFIGTGLHFDTHWKLQPAPAPANLKEWISPTDPRNAFTNDSLGMVADLWAPFLENYDPNSAVNHDRLIEIARQQRENSEGKSELSDTLRIKGWTSPFIITTLSMTLEVKKRLPKAGVKWLYVRAYAKSIVQGKYDVEVLIMDESMELVALSRQVALAAVFKPEVRDKARFEIKSKV